MHILNAIMQDESGATAIEYGLIAVIIAIAAIVGMDSLGGQLSQTFSRVAANYSAANR